MWGSLLVWWTTLSSLLSLGLQSGIPQRLQKATAPVRLPVRMLCQPPHSTATSFFLSSARWTICSFFKKKFLYLFLGNKHILSPWMNCADNGSHENFTCLSPRKILGHRHQDDISIMQRTNDLHSLGDTMSGLIGVCWGGLEWKLKFSQTSPGNFRQKCELQASETMQFIVLFLYNCGNRRNVPYMSADWIRR